MADIVVVHGYAGAGKSTQSPRLVAEGFEGVAVQHVSAGNRLRDIRTGVAPSIYSDIINSPNAPSPLPDEIVSGAIFETIEETDTGLVLIDGYPRHPRAVEPFYEALQERMHSFLGTIAMEISVEVSVERILLRGKREGEKIKADSLEEFARLRYEKDRVTTNIAVEALSQYAPVERIDAGNDVDTVYSDFKQALSRLRLQNPNPVQ